MIKASSYGKTLICKTCKAEILPIGESDYFSISNPNYSEYPVCPGLPWPWRAADPPLVQTAAWHEVRHHRS